MILLEKWDTNGILGMKVQTPSGVSTYKLKSTRNPRKGSPALQLFISKVK